MKLKPRLVLWALLATGTTNATFGCVCAEQVLNDRDAAREQFSAATVVLEGEVLRGEKIVSTADRYGPGLSEISFLVITSYKGNLDHTLQVYDPHAGSDCAFVGLKPGDKFFVYGFAGKDRKIYVETCGRTSRLENAGPDVRFARGEPATPEDLIPPSEKWRIREEPELAKRGATLSGRVRCQDRTEPGSVFLTVWNVNESGNRENLVADTRKVNDDGTFDVRYLRSGSYLLTAVDNPWGPNSRCVGTGSPVHLKEGERLANVELLLRSEPLGVVKVKVDTSSTLHDQITVVLRDVTMDTENPSIYPYGTVQKLDFENVATFGSVPYGRYSLRVILTGEGPWWLWWDDVEITLAGAQVETFIPQKSKAQKQ